MEREWEEGTESGVWVGYWWDGFRLLDVGFGCGRCRWIWMNLDGFVGRCYKLRDQNGRMRSLKEGRRTCPDMPIPVHDLVNPRAMILQIVARGTRSYGRFSIRADFLFEIPYFSYTHGICREQNGRRRGCIGRRDIGIQSFNRSGMCGY